MISGERRELDEFASLDAFARSFAVRAVRERGPARLSEGDPARAPFFFAERVLSAETCREAGASGRRELFPLVLTARFE